MRNQSTDSRQDNPSPETMGWTAGMISWAAPVVVPTALFLLYRLVLSDVFAEITP